VDLLSLKTKRREDPMRALFAREKSEEISLHITPSRKKNDEGSRIYLIQKKNAWQKCPGLACKGDFKMTVFLFASHFPDNPPGPGPDGSPPELPQLAFMKEPYSSETKSQIMPATLDACGVLKASWDSRVADLIIAIAVFTLYCVRKEKYVLSPFFSPNTSLPSSWKPTSVCWLSRSMRRETRASSRLQNRRELAFRPYATVGQALQAREQGRLITSLSADDHNVKTTCGYRR